MAASGTPSSTPLRERLDAILLTRDGSLQETSYPLLLLAIALREKSAVLRLRRNQLQKEIIFEAGHAVDCRSNIATETLSRFLVAAGKLSESDAHNAFSVSTSRGVPLEEIITERQLVPPTELYRMLQQNLGRKLLEPFSWTTGTYEISFQVPAIVSALRVRVPQLIATGIMKVEPQETVDAATAALEGKRIVPGASPLYDADDLRLTPEHQRVLEVVHSAALLGELRGKSGLPADDFNRIITTFLLLGVVEAIDPAERREPVTIRSAAPAPAAEPPLAARQATDSATTEEVMAAYLSYRRKDAFELLGLADDAGAVDITRSYLALAEKFLPANFAPKTPDGLREKAQEIFLAAARAYSELIDPLKRGDLLAERKRRRERTEAEAAGRIAAAEAPQARAALIDPEALCAKGRELVAVGKLREALSYFEMAAECDAQNGTYAAEVAYTRFQLMISPAQVALKTLKNAIRIDPRCGLAYLYTGKLHATLGNKLEAEGYLARASKMLPRDPRPIEAMRALR